MSLTLYQMPHSPYCIPLTRALDALGEPYEVINVEPHTRREVIEASGGRYYQVPMLDHDGEIVMESGPESIDIPRYVDAKFAGGRLFPAGMEAAQVATVTFIENDLEVAGFRIGDPKYIAEFEDPLVRTLIIRHKERKFGVGCVEDWAANHDKYLAHFTEMLGPFDTSFAQQQFLFGDQPLYADFALYGVLANFTWNDRGQIPESLPNLKQWFEQFAEFRFC